jgi:hypothetical protein
MDELDLLKKRIRNEGKVNESAIKKPRRTGKDKSFLRIACQLGHICNRAPIRRNGLEYVNPMSNGDKLYLEQVHPTAYVEYKDYEFYDKDNNLIHLFD